MSQSLQPVVIALGSNLGDRKYELRRAIHAMRSHVQIVRQSPIVETEPVDAPHGSGDFLNMVVAGWTRLAPHGLLEVLHEIENGRRRSRRVRNEPRRIDLDLIFFGSRVVRTRELQIPHPRYRTREFVMGPLRSLGLTWVDPVSGLSFGRH